MHICFGPTCEPELLVPEAGAQGEPLCKQGLDCPTFHFGRAERGWRPNLRLQPHNTLFFTPSHQVIASAMAFNDVNPTLRYLTDAGNLLANMSPETAAFVMRERDSLMFENELTQPESQRQNVCTCCGHILVMGCGGSSLVFKSEKRVVPKKARSTGHGGQKESRRQAGPTKVLTCGHCGRLTETKFPAPAPISRRAMRARRVVKTPAQSQVPAPATNSRSTLERAREPVQKSTASGNSKKRAKSRKAGLQALLEQSSASRSGLGLGLSLSSFMKK